MKKLFILASLLIGMVGNMKADDIVVATYGNATGNTTRTMTVALNRTTNYVACQFDLTLPEGTTVKSITPKAPLINGGTVDLSAVGGTASETTNFVVDFNQTGTTCKVIAYNLGNVNIGGESGDVLMTVELQTTNEVNFDETSVAASGINFVNGSLEAAPMANVAENADEKSLWGDVIKDGTIDGYDIQAVANLFAGKAVNVPVGKKLDKFAADTDQNDKYDGYDIQRVANIFAGK